MHYKIFWDDGQIQWLDENGKDIIAGPLGLHKIVI